MEFNPFNRVLGPRADRNRLPQINGDVPQKLELSVDDGANETQNTTINDAKPLLNATVLKEIREKLKNGDISGLDDLDRYGVNYSLIESANGYTVKFSFNGNNYTINYVEPDETTMLILNYQITLQMWVGMNKMV